VVGRFVFGLLRGAYDSGRGCRAPIDRVERACSGAFAGLSAVIFAFVMAPRACGQTRRRSSRRAFTD
jgi:hypothetical protein